MKASFSSTPLLSLKPSMPNNTSIFYTYGAHAQLSQSPRNTPCDEWILKSEDVAQNHTHDSPMVSSIPYNFDLLREVY